MKLRNLVFVLVLLLAACTAQEQSAVSNILVEEAEPVLPPADVDQSEPAVGQPQVDSPPADEESINPPVKTGLEATDPAAVALASGQPTLVEFFAFW